ncbi:MAG: hypothetical protein RKE49_00245 [Oceanicaulis sp.]
MEWRGQRTDYTLREPAALGALLHYDWRLRGVLTDTELINSLDEALGTSVLRHLQRIGLIRAVHGVRAQGGRMRLWTMPDVLKVQAALALRRATGAKLSACADVLIANEAMLAPLFTDWEERPAPNAEDAPGSKASVMSHPAALQNAVAGAVHAYIERNRFDEAAAPAFLL